MKFKFFHEFFPLLQRAPFNEQTKVTSAEFESGQPHELSTLADQDLFPLVPGRAANWAVRLPPGTVWIFTQKFGRPKVLLEKFQKCRNYMSFRERTTHFRTSFNTFGQDFKFCPTPKTALFKIWNLYMPRCAHGNI